MKILKFQYKDKEEPIEYTHILASKMQTCEKEDILRYDAVMEEFDKEIIQNAINLLQIENLRIHLIS